MPRVSRLYLKIFRALEYILIKFPKQIPRRKILGVAVAAGLCTLSVGTETSGSIISPAGRSGIVGIKPTIGLVSRSGIIPIASTFDTAGPMARTVRDAAILLNILAGEDPSDAATQIKKQRNSIDYTSQLNSKRLDGIRIGINSPQGTEEYKVPQPSEKRKEAFARLCAMLTDAGAVLVEEVNTSYIYNMGGVMHNEFKASINYYLSTLNGSTKMKTLGDIVKFNQNHAQTALKYGQSLLLGAENNTSGAMLEPAYAEGLLAREEAITELDKAFDDHNIDVMLCETFTNIAPFTGFPSMTIPIGQAENNVPIDSYWIARRFDEATMIKICYVAEQLLDLNIRPEL